MITFITWVAFIGVGIAALVWLTIVGLIMGKLFGYDPRKCSYPPPDRAAERMYDIQYFVRAIGRK